MPTLIEQAVDSLRHEAGGETDRPSARGRIGRRRRVGGSPPPPPGDRQPRDQCHQAHSARREDRSADGARLSVTDNGAGIAAEALPHVFERFRQGDQRVSRTHGGLGLGLAIVRSIVTLHGGTVVAESAGRGPWLVAEAAKRSPASGSRSGSGGMELEAAR